MNDLTFLGNDYLDLRDVIAKYVNLTELDDEDRDDEDDYYIDSVKQIMDGLGLDLDGLREYAENEPTMIRDHEFINYAEELAYDIGAVSRDARWPLDCIDWDSAAEDLLADYSEIGVGVYTYYIRAY